MVMSVMIKDKIGSSLSSDLLMIKITCNSAVETDQLLVNYRIVPCVFVCLLVLRHSYCIHDLFVVLVINIVRQMTLFSNNDTLTGFRNC